MIKLFSTHCPKCKIIEMKLQQKNIDFVLEENVDEVVEVGRKVGILSAPILQVEDKFLDFAAAVKYINEHEQVEDNCNYSSCSL